MSASDHPSLSSRKPSRRKSVEEHLEDLLEEKKQMVEDAEEERRTEHTSYSNTGVWQGMKWTFVFAVLLWWFPIYGQMIAGYIGGRKAGSASKALIASSVPAALILGLAYSIDNGYIPIPKEWLTEGPKYVSERISEVLPVGIPYIDVLVTSFSSVLTAQMNYFAVIVLFALIGGVLADEGTKTTVVKGYKITGQYSFFDDAPHRVDSAIDTLVDKVADVIGVRDDSKHALSSRKLENKNHKKGWSSEHLVTPEIQDDADDFYDADVQSKDEHIYELEDFRNDIGKKEDLDKKNNFFQKSRVSERKVPDILARPRKSTLEKLGVYEEKELPVEEKRRKLVEEQAWTPKKLASKNIDDSWTKKEKVKWSPKEVEKHKIWPKLRKKDISAYQDARLDLIQKVTEDVKIEEQIDSKVHKPGKEEDKDLDSIRIGSKEIKEIKKEEELNHKHRVTKLPKYLQPEEEHLWDADLKVVDSQDDFVEQKQITMNKRNEKSHFEKSKQERSKPEAPEPFEDIILLDSGILVSENAKDAKKPDDGKGKGSGKKENKEEEDLQLRFDDEEIEPSDWDKL